MSKENAEQLLNSVMQDEKDVQDKVKKQQVIQGGLPADFCRNSRSHANASRLVVNPRFVFRNASPNQFL